jgi:hypothetical protein
MIPLGFAGVLALAVAAPENLSTLDNGVIRIGVDLDQGGSITLLGRSPDGANLINSHDLGRQIQQSYYGGPRPFGQAHPGWKDWPWNPIGSGDVFGHRARVLELHNDGRELHVKSIPMQWALENVPGDCTFETWITLEGSSARVRCRLNNNREDTTWYPAMDQELPAVYTNGPWHRLVTYSGDRPFTGGAVSTITNAGPPWASWTATENWAALLDDQGTGLGVIHPGACHFLGGFLGTPGAGGPKDDATGYIAPVRPEILDHNISYEYRYCLVLGTLDEIRAVAARECIQDGRPDDHFQRDRQHWTYRNVRDSGLPLAGGLRVRPTGDDPQIRSPEQWWPAEQVPRLYLRAAFRSRESMVALFWRVPGQEFSEERRMDFPVNPDGVMRTYAIDLAGRPGYQGTITGLRLDPFSTFDPDAEVLVESISWRPDE